MSRRDVSRLLLAVLAALALGLAVRACVERERERGFVDFGGGWDPDRLRHYAFRLERPARLAVASAGSFETDSALAAYGWIVRRADRAVVWQMTPEHARRERGSLAVAADTLGLDAGTYDAYFTTFGDPLLAVEAGGSFAERLGELLRFGNRAWTSDASKWAFRLALLDPADAPFAHRLAREDVRDAAPAGPGLVWAGGPAGTDETLAHTFEVRRPTALRLEATGEIFDAPSDVGWIDNLSTGERVWTMDRANTVWAGGSVKNRRAEATLALAPGLYGAGFRTDGSHDAGQWRANPPLDPAAWGLFLWTDDPAAVAAFDPWDRLPRLVGITGVGDDAFETATFALADSLRVWVYALGELSDRDERYDYAWLVRDGAGTVWEMDYDRTRPAGGGRPHPFAAAALPRAPGP